MSKWLAAILLLSSCSEVGETQDYLPVTETEPKLGPTQTFAGVWSLGFEMSNFIYCDDGAENCTHAAFGDGGCWLMSAGEKPQEIEKMIGGKVEEVDKLYVKFEGRETLKRGQYGHLGQYSCEIWGEKLISAKRINSAPEEPE